MDISDKNVMSEPQLLAMTSQVHGNISKAAQIHTCISSFAIRAAGFVRFLWPVLTGKQKMDSVSESQCRNYIQCVT
jgi:hypothetical protein